MKLSIIDTGFFKLDGGAMFGVVPKILWSKLNPPDDNNLCQWSMRCLLIETENRKVLIDTGIGNKQDDKFMSHFEPHGDTSLIQSIRESSVSVEEITDVLITHFHFDHVGGAVARQGDELIPTFPNARYWTCKDHFDWAYTPNEREKASFLKENFVPLADHGVLHYIPLEEGYEFLPGINISFSYGHTEAMIIPEISLPNGNKLIFCADLMPSSFHIRKPYVMAYDIRPLVTLEEREIFYTKALEENTYLFFEHDPKFAIGKLRKNEKNRNYIDTDINFESVTSQLL